MANRKSIKNYDVLNDITGKEDEIVLIGYDNTNNSTKGVLASALGSSSDSGVYDLVIRTQQEFNDMIANPTWLDAQSVVLVGEFTADANIVIPPTVKQIHGYNGATLVIVDTAGSGVMFGYLNLPASEDYEIRNLKLTITCPDNSSTGFSSCRNLVNCETDVNALESAGFAHCTNLINCKTVAFGSGGPADGFRECKNLVNCRGTGASGEGGTCFSGCTSLTNCVGVDRSSDYGFYNTSIASNCSVEFEENTAMSAWGAPNTDIDADSCPGYTAP